MVEYGTIRADRSSIEMPTLTAPPSPLSPGNWAFSNPSLHKDPEPFSTGTQPPLKNVSALRLLPTEQLRQEEPSSPTGILPISAKPRQFVESLCRTSCRTKTLGRDRVLVHGGCRLEESHRLAYTTPETRVSLSSQGPARHIVSGADADPIHIVRPSVRSTR